jgi:hypothetical protein
MKRYVLCINNDGYEIDLVVRKVYEVLPDDFADQHTMLRIIDESGEDYLFDADRFIPIEVPEQAQAIFGAEIV